MIPFTHLHVQLAIFHSRRRGKRTRLVMKAKNDGMTALALTDHGNMFGIKEFYDTCKKEG
jgi:DNA polymerase-3 subunit alpha